MSKRYLSFFVTMLLLFSLLSPATSTVVFANDEQEQQVTAGEQAAQHEIQVEVEGLTQTLLNETIQIAEGQHALHALKTALDAKGIPYTIQESSFGSYVSSINNEDAATFGGWDGWNYSVNGQEPQVGADSYVLSSNDQLKFYYGRWAAISSQSIVKPNQVNPSVTIDLIGDTFTAKATNPAMWTISGDQLDLQVSKITQQSDQQVTVHFSGVAQSGELLLEALDGVVVGKPADAIKFVVESDLSDSELVQQAIQKVSTHILSGNVSSEWQVAGLARAGVAIPTSYEKFFYENLQTQVISKSGGGRLKITDVERLAIAAAAMGKDPRDVLNFDLIEKIYNSENWTNGQDSLTFQGNNGIIFALIALDTKNYEVPNNARWDRQKLVTELLKYQKEDGSWSLMSSTTGSSSVDITAMALTALAPYNGQARVEQAVERAVRYLSAQQGNTGGFDDPFVGGISSEATSQVIIGLTANGIDPRGEQFTKNGINLFDHLMTFQADNGGFKHTAQESGSNGMATEQALQALVAFDLYLKNDGRLYDFSQQESQLKISGPSHLEAILEGTLVKIKKYQDAIWSPISIEKAESVGGYYIIQAGEQGSQESTVLPEGTKEVFLVENARSYHYFDAEVVAANKEWKITFNQPLLNEKENLKRIYVENGQGQKMSVNITVSTDGTQATVTPAENYKQGELYSLFIIDAVSTNGKTLRQATRKLFIIE